jgi:ATP adenylyltransferase
MPSADHQPEPDNPNPDGPDTLWAPWRLRYLESFVEDDHNADMKRAPGGAEPTPAPTGPPASSSFFADYWADPDADGEHHVILRTADGMVLLNRYPYANGHLLVALGEARPRLLDYTPDQRAAFWRLVDTATDLMERTLSPQGINTGINQGRAAGAGIPTHLHAHLVPRWGGDVNFITIVGQVRIVPAALDAMCERYRRVWETMRRA